MVASVRQPRQTGGGQGRRQQPRPRLGGVEELVVAERVAQNCRRKILLQVTPQVGQMWACRRRPYGLLDEAGESVRVDQITLDLVAPPA